MSQGGPSFWLVNQAGLERIAQFVDEEGIDCDFERKSNYAYAENEEQTAQVKEEVEVRLEKPGALVARQVGDPALFAGRPAGVSTRTIDGVEAAVVEALPRAPLVEARVTP